MDETKYWVWLTMVFGTGNPRIWEAMCIFETALDAYMGLKSESMIKRLKPKEQQKIASTKIEQAVSLIEQHRKNNIEIVCYNSEYYPLQLKFIYNPPAVIYCKGNVSCLKSEKTVTAVGTRNASEYSIRVTEQICSQLAMAGYVIVSGFAVGIDITAHLSASDRNRPTICVMGGGVDVDYPRENFVYRDRILKNGGLFISEYPMGTRPLPQNFPKRNRILSAMGYATIVFEASDKSGSLITAGLSAEYGREVFCVPPANILSRKYSGNAELIRDGAEILFDCEDIFRYFAVIEEECNFDFYDCYIGRDSFNKNLSGDDDGNELPLYSEEELNGEEVLLYSKNETKNTDYKLHSAENRTETEENLTEVQKKIYGLFGSEPLHTDMIASALGIGTDELFFELTELEINGFIKSLPGKMYEKI